MRARFLVILAGIAALAVSGCSGKGSNSGKNGTVTIVYTGNVCANILPCGCRPPLGGLARRAGALAQIKMEFPEALVLDSGALLYETPALNPTYAGVDREYARLMAEEVKRSGIDAVNVSPVDLAGSLDSLLAGGSQGLPWCSVNVVSGKTGKPVFPAHVIRTAAGMKIGIFGFTDERNMGIPFFDDGAPVRILDPINSARSEVDRLRKECDIVVGLAYMDMDRTRELVRAVPGIDVIVMSHAGDYSPSSEPENFAPVKEGETLIVRCPDGGRLIGRLDLTVVNGVTDFAAQDIRPAEVVVREQKNAASMYRNTFITLSSQIPSPPELEKRAREVYLLIKKRYVDVESNR